MTEETFQFPWIKPNYGIKNWPKMIFYTLFNLITMTILVFFAIASMTLVLPLHWLGYELLYARIASAVIGIPFIHWCKMIEWHVDLEFSGDIIPDHENALLVSNHLSDTDFLMIMNIAVRHGMLGCIKYFAKDSIKWFPGVGYGMIISGMIFLKRNWNRDQASIRSTFDYYVRNQLPCWIVNFLEGTRLTDKKLKDSQAYQKKNKLPVTKQVMCPRVKGFIAMVKGFRDEQIEYIYDITFAPVDGRISLFQVATGMVNPHHKIVIHLNRIPISTIPREDDDIKEWAFDLFRKKDAWLQSYNPKTKTFGKSNTYPLPFTIKDWYSKPYQQAISNASSSSSTKKKQN